MYPTHDPPFASSSGAEFDCGEDLDASAPKGLMDVGVNDITYWCPGVEENVTILQPSFPQCCILL